MSSIIGKLILAHIIQNDLVPPDWIAEHTVGYEKVRAHFCDISVEDYSAFAGLKVVDVRAAGDAIAKSDATALYEDIGLQMAPHSTLATYLNMLLMITTGNFGKAGTMSVIEGLPGPMFSKAGQGPVNDEGYETGWKTSPVTHSRVVSGLVPCNDVPAAILTENPLAPDDRWLRSACAIGLDQSVLQHFALSLGAGIGGRRGHISGQTWCWGRPTSKAASRIVALPIRPPARCSGPTAWPGTARGCGWPTPATAAC